MSSLTDQILDRFATGETLDRAQLAIDANYDSVGRALRQLVDDGKLIRMGRGRYKKALRKGAVSAATIADSIRRQIDRSKRNVFLRGDFSKLGRSYDAVGRALRQLTEQGRLVQIGHGLYAKAERSPFTGKPAPIVGIGRLATEALARLGKPVARSTSDRAYSSGRSTQVPTGRKVAVSDRVRRRIGYDGNYVVFERA
ncbi:hypothetical protein GCM10023232_06930 [Sphingosinicella ginsenosidimutans]|uniref:AbiEi antitoxin N-terminal domain-containing protein n=1 Tax=Allosphingosinicella ginsenosidimutans TaxID=1176539 RepID=A0A5C6TVZ4_9SPHN|nr:type IV toxin-antitoxin system AbiEi family antitoxin domain-containing protein [Sphingosinicella ginsenosidimutans]TXC64527.1 hypothetical protein FRZ32_13210 [Sphingosinicella ginsenosidimutans]